ncbi:MAG: restriction endonuclease subunit S [Cuspidothrix sp.]
MKTLFLPIGVFCKTGSGTTPSRNKYERYFNGSIPWVKSGELRESIITETEEKVTEEALAETSLKLAPKGSVLVAMYGANVGRVGILGINATTNQAVCYLVPEKDKADSRYLFHALQQKLPEFISRSVGGAQPNISQQIIRETKIPLPPLEEQKRIAEILDQAEELRRKRREAIAQLDTLTQSIFLEMFGDPVKNPKNIKTLPLAKVCKRITDGTHQPPKWSTSGYPFLFVSNIVSGEINFDTVKFISSETHEELTRRCPIEFSDVLYSTVGSYGVPVIVKTQRKFAFQRHIAHIKPDLNLIDSQFLCAMLASPALKRQADRSARGIAQKTVNLEEIRKFIIILPPLSLQKEFAQRVEAVEELKKSHRASLSELDALFASLQHRAFRGEL